MWCRWGCEYVLLSTGTSFHFHLFTHLLSLPVVRLLFHHTSGPRPATTSPLPTPLPLISLLPHPPLQPTSPPASPPPLPSPFSLFPILQLLHAPPLSSSTHHIPQLPPSHIPAILGGSLKSKQPATFPRPCPLLAPRRFPLPDRRRNGRFRCGGEDHG